MTSKRSSTFDLRNNGLLDKARPRVKNHFG
jgi:hypothetical protein